MDLNLVQILFDVETDRADVYVAYYYQSLRKFELLFRQSCCLYELKPCIVCKEQYACPYQAVFAQNMSADPDVVRRHQKPSLPFAFKITQLPNQSSCLEISLVIVGNAVNHIYVFINAVRRLIESTPQPFSGRGADITGIYCLDNQSSRHKLVCLSNSIQGLVLLSSLDIMKNSAGIDTVRLILESPLRLLSVGSVLHCFDITIFFRSQMRRCSSMFAYYGDGELEDDFAELSLEVNRAKCISNGTRYLQPCWSKSPNYSGLTGIAEFALVTSGILPFLTLGSYLNAGKSASFGFGAYRTELCS